MKGRQGFTIIELLVVVSIIGLLASIALPRYAMLKERALTASMVSDLRNLLTSQESFFSTHGDYAGGIVPGPEIPGTGGAGRVSMQVSEGVVITVSYRTNPAQGEGWSATAHHPGVSDPDNDECGIFVGHPAFSPGVEVTGPGVIRCY